MQFPSIDPILFSIGPLHIRWYGIAYLAGIILPLFIFRHSFRHVLKLTLDDALNLISYAILGIVIGGRVGYVLVYDMSSFIESPWIMFAIWNGGMSYHGGILGCALSCLLFAKHQSINHWKLLDLIAISSTIGIGLGRLANFINGELYGRVTSSPFGMIFPMGGPYPRHPSQLYEAFFEGFVLFLILWIIRRYVPLQPGILGSIYLILYSLFRFAIEFFREPDYHLGFIISFLTMGQILCLIECAIGVVILIYIVKKTSHKV